MSTQHLIDALQRPDAYNHPVNTFKLLETHISWVILTGDYAYKIKKPVNFGFVDYTELAQRKFFCEEELRLNQTMAGPLYLDVVTINESPEGPVMGGNGPILEYALKMREFSQDNLFNHLLENNRLTPDLIDAVGQTIADGHQDANTATAEQPFGSPEHIYAPVQQNFEQIAPLLTEPAQQTQLQQLADWSKQQHEQLLPYFIQRKAQGMVHECHGDLHLGNMTLFEGETLIFDRIEFNEDFKWTDVMADIGFVCMDLEYRKCPAYSARFLNRYLECSGDFWGLHVLPYYKVYRAVVRAKINLLPNTDPSLSKAQQEANVKAYCSYSDLAHQFTQKTTPQLIIMHGLSGSGKSTLAKQLVEQLSAIRISSDTERKRLFGLTANARSAQADAIYNEQATADTYAQLHASAEHSLNAGYTTIIDATCLKQAQRAAFYEQARTLQVPYTVLHCTGNPELLASNVQHRQAKNDFSSEATVDVLERQKHWQEALSDDEKERVIRVDTRSICDNAFVKALVEKLMAMQYGS